MALPLIVIVKISSSYETDAFRPINSHKFSTMFNPNPLDASFFDLSIV